MIRKALSLLFCLALTTSIITKRRRDQYDELIAAEGDQVNNDQYCAQVDVLNQCTYCYASFVVGNKCVVPNKTVDHCLSYSADGYCELCQYNFTQKDGKCELITIPNCLETEQYDTEKCTACVDGKLITADGQCTSKTECGVKNCQVCGIKGEYEYCELCQDKYVLAIGEDTEGNPFFQCIPETGLIQNCDIVNSEKPSDCLQCKLNYFMNEDRSCTKSNSYDLERYGKGVQNLIASLMITFILFQLNFN